MLKYLKFITLFCLSTLSAYGEDSLKSWNEGLTKSAIISFVDAVTDSSGKNFVPKEDRIAAFDLDGTLLCELPVNFQRSLALKRLKEMALRNPELVLQQPYKAANFDDSHYYNLKENHSFVFLKAFEGQTRDFYLDYIHAYLAHESAPYWGRPFQELFYKPCLELFAYLKANGFKVYICSTSEEECIRMLLSQVLGLSSSEVMGNEVAMEYLEEGGDVLFRFKSEFEVPECRGLSKCQHWVRHVGKRPIFTFGNSMGDYGLLKYTSSSKGVHFEMILDHDDPARELEYHSQELLSHAKSLGWHIISMRNDFKTVFAMDSTQE